MEPCYGGALRTPSVNEADNGIDHSQIHGPRRTRPRWALGLVFISSACSQIESPKDRSQRGGPDAPRNSDSQQTVCRLATRNGSCTRVRSRVPIVNGGFETGNLAGWASSTFVGPEGGPPPGCGPYNGVVNGLPLLGPTGGSYMAMITTPAAEGGGQHLSEWAACDRYYRRMRTRFVAISCIRHCRLRPASIWAGDTQNCGRQYRLHRLAMSSLTGIYYQTTPHPSIARS